MPGRMMTEGRGGPDRKTWSLGTFNICVLPFGLGGADTVAEGVGWIKKSNNAEILMDINDRTVRPCEV